MTDFEKTLPIAQWEIIPANGRIRLHAYGEILLEIWSLYPSGYAYQIKGMEPSLPVEVHTDDPVIVRTQALNHLKAVLETRLESTTYALNSFLYSH